MAKKKRGSPKKIPVGKENHGMQKQQPQQEEVLVEKEEDHHAAVEDTNDKASAENKAPEKSEDSLSEADQDQAEADTTEKVTSKDMDDTDSIRDKSNKRKLEGDADTSSPNADKASTDKAKETPVKGDDKAEEEDNDDEDEEHSKPAAKEKAELPSDIDLTQPIKKARTAYFIFMEERRPEVQAKFKGEGVAKVAKELGHIWSTMPAEEKEVFQEKAALEREQVAQKLAQLEAAGIDLAKLPGAATPVDTSSLNTLIYPLGRMRKVCKLDPEVKGLSKEALVLVTKCTELMTSKLGIETVRVAQIQNRRKLLPDDIAQVCATREQFLFLQDDVRDLVRDQVAEKQKEKDSNPNSKQTVAAQTASSKPLTAYFSAGK